MEENFIKEIDVLTNGISEYIDNAKYNVIRYANQKLLERNWNIGKYIVENLQGGEKRASYGAKILEEVSKRLTEKYGSGFSERNLELMRKFYLCFPISQPVAAKLSWRHYTDLIVLNNVNERTFYIEQCLNNNWSARELERMIKSKLYERTKNGSGIETALASKITEPIELIKEPYVFEFFGLNDNDNYTERELEESIINHLKEFILEIGKSFSYVGRQIRITINGINYYIDIVFYNHELNCYFIFELKNRKLNSKDVGQISLYKNYYDEHIKKESDNETVGILIGTDKDRLEIKYATMKDKNILSSKYILHLPTKEELYNLK